MMPAPLGGTDLPVEQTRRVTIATYGDYASAQRAVDFLSDNAFPVDRTAIIGTDLRLVETVLGRLTIGRAALQGTAVGAWFGLFIGLLFGIFAVAGWFAVVLAGVLIGALWGAVFGGLAHALTRGQRDFSSRRSLVAAHYDVTVDADHHEQASRLLATMRERSTRS